MDLFLYLTSVLTIVNLDVRFFLSHISLEPFAYSWCMTETRSPAYGEDAPLRDFQNQMKVEVTKDSNSHAGGAQTMGRSGTRPSRRNSQGIGGFGSTRTGWRRA